MRDGVVHFVRHGVALVIRDGEKFVVIYVYIYNRYIFLCVIRDRKALVTRDGVVLVMINAESLVISMFFCFLSQGNNWLLGEAVIQSSSNFSVYFDGIVGNGYTGDIAIDDVSLKPGGCQGDGKWCF